MGGLVAVAIPFWPERRPAGLTPAAWSWWLAAFAAARRASRVDPVAALRGD
jgi:hypothetical protein